MNCYSFITKILHRKKIESGEDFFDNDMSPCESETVNTLKKLLDEKNQELKSKHEIITLLEQDLEKKEGLIKYLQNEIDKFRQVVKPLTQKIISKQLSLVDDVISSIEDTKVQNLAEQRTKRQAISAEPLSKDEKELHITKFPKPFR